MKTLVKIAFLSAAALTIAGIAHADHRDYRIALANQDKYGHPVYDETAAKPEEAPQIKEKTYNVSASDVDTAATIESLSLIPATQETDCSRNKNISWNTWTCPNRHVLFCFP